jgi:hypothetical protein
MTVHRTLAGAAALALLGATGVMASDWRQVSDPAELRALYSDKTYRFNHSEVNKPAALHYRADGKGLLVLDGRRYPRTWELEGRDQVCIRDEIRGRLCYNVLRNSKNPSEVLVNPTNGGMGSFMTMEHGVPEF